MKPKYRIRKRYEGARIQTLPVHHFELRYMPQQLVKVLWWSYYENMCPEKGFYNEQDALKVIMAHKHFAPIPKTEEYTYVP